MNQSLGNFRPHTSHNTGDQYLDAAVRMASPAKLRLMLLERSVAVCDTLAEDWRKKEMLGANEYSITLVDLLNELLSGVAGSETKSEVKLCQQVSDLYVFLLKHVVIAEQHSDPEAIDEIRLVLETETETWRAVVAMQSKSTESPESQITSSSGGISFSA